MNKNTPKNNHSEKTEKSESTSTKPLTAEDRERIEKERVDALTRDA